MGMIVLALFTVDEINTIVMVFFFLLVSIFIDVFIINFNFADFLF